MKKAEKRLVCPITGEGASFYCRKPPADYYIAEHSGLIFVKDLPDVNEMVAYADNEYSNGLYKDYAQAAELKYATFERRIRLIENLGIRRGRLLDVGCACGFFLEAALTHGFDAWGVEFSREAVALSRSDIQSRITLGDVNHLNHWNKDKFDVIVAFDIIEHTQSPLQFLANIRQILRPGGWLLLATPDTGHFLRYLMGRNWPMLQPMQHTFLFSKTAMHLALEKAGYEKIGVRNADKSLTLDYLMEQMRVHNPIIKRIYDALSGLLPRGIRKKSFAVNIGEMLAYAQRKPEATAL
jgi:2-polyprenyl-3-methyl-5-hydroxy-6-metoxy-1,4-benzoquinol methylase